MALSSLEGEWSIKESADSLVVSIIVQAASAAELEVDVAPTSVSVRDNKSTHRLDLPCTVLPDTCQVKFRKAKQELQLVLVRSPLDAGQKQQQQEQQQTGCHSQDDDDDDDMPPPLEAARSAPCKSSSEDLASDVQRAVDAAANLNAEDLADGGHTNEYATALMKKALAVREQKHKETEQDRKKADLASSGGLKKGFLSGGKSRKSQTEKRRTSPAKSNSEVEEIPFIRGSADPEAARRESLKLPEVQRALQQGTQKLKEDKSWVTPQLLQALGSRPDISKAMSDPKVQEAMQLMQTDPEAAKKKYKDDVEVTKFLKDFTGLMATHFEVLGNEVPKTPKPAQPPVESQKAIDAPLTGLDLCAKPPPMMARPSSNGEKLPTDDPKVMAAMQDPEVMALIAAIRAGQPLELHQIARTNERLFMKVKILLDNGLLAMQH